jgi:hypothetical protein
MDRGLISQKGRGLIAKSTGFSGAELFINGKIRWTQSTICGPLRVSVHIGLAMVDRRGSQELDVAVASGHGGSPVMAQLREGSTGSPSRASPGR